MHAQHPAPQPGQRPTLEAVAARAGVGRGTVSRVINGSAKVAPRTRDAVLRAVDELGYVPNPAARALVRRRTDTVAFVVTVPQERVFWEEPYFSAIVRGVTLGLAGTGLQPLLAVAQSAEDHQRLTSYLTAGHVDGVLLSSLRGDDPLPGRLESAGIPTVMVGAPTGYEPQWGVDLDNGAGARLAVRHLVSVGRRRIATITGPQTTRAGVDRLTSWREEMRAAGLTDDLAEIGDFTAESGNAAMHRLLDRAPGLDAVFAASDSMAIGALRALRERDRTVPGDVAVIGFDDSPLAAETNPPLTSVHQPLEDMGREMARLLVARINGESVASHRVIFQPGLVLRASA
jgi:DNA-binding LacI/PurR family transcriptional regulator